MAAKKAPADPGLEEIASWGRWFVSGHTAILAEQALSPQARARALESIVELAAAITGRMRSDYLANRQR